MSFRTTAATRFLALSLAVATWSVAAMPLAAQTSTAQTSSMTSQPGDTPATHTWTNDQILTATVHQAWILGGKDETGFFDIVKALAEISAQNRGLVMPEDTASGQKAGAIIRKKAKADHDQLLYAIVDEAIRKVGTKAPVSGN